MSDNFHGFVEWKEDFVSQEKGNRVVHYYLKDSAGDSTLAVVGTERSVRHMIYVVSDEFLEAYGSENSITANFKWRSKREVVDWLTSLLSKQQHLPQNSSKSPKYDSVLALRSPNFVTDGLKAPGTHLRYPMSRFSRKLKGHSSDIAWSGDAWTCGKQLTHYPAFCRNKTVIAIHSFVLVMAKEEKHYLAYLEDMYEDRKGHKKVKVRWFHDNQEVEGLISLPNRHPKEVFITPYVQIVSAECVDGPATVLIPEHFEKCLDALSQLYSAKVHMCSRQFRNNAVKPFDLTKLRGYFEQAIFSCIENEEEFSHGGTIKKGVKRSRSYRGRQRFVTSHSGLRISGPACQNLSFGSSSGRRSMTIKYVVPKLPQPFKVHEKIELLCQDSGIRGCWFRCTILQMSQKQLKVRYDDVQNEDDCGNLEEWVPAFRVAAPDKLGMRSAGRYMIRPSRSPEDLFDSVLEIGASVDAWWNDGWWEGVVTDIDFCEDHSLQVYFPGENMLSTFQRSKLRSSRDWVGNQWVDIEPKPDIVSVISAVVNPGLKLSACSTNTNRANSHSSGISRHEVPSDSKLGTVEEDMQELDGLAVSGNLPENVKWVNSEQRPVNEEKGERSDDPDADESKDHDKDKDTTLENDDGNLLENVKWVNSEKRPWNEEKGEGGDYPDANGEKVKKKDKDKAFGDDDDGEKMVEMTVDIDVAGQKYEEAVDPMEVVV